MDADYLDIVDRVHLIRFKIVGTAQTNLFFGGAKSHQLRLAHLLSQLRSITPGKSSAEDIERTLSDIEASFASIVDDVVGARACSDQERTLMEQASVRLRQQADEVVDHHGRTLNELIALLESMQAHALSVGGRRGASLLDAQRATLRAQCCADGIEFIRAAADLIECGLGSQDAVVD